MDLHLWGIATDAGLFVLIWLVQLIIYPVFHRIPEDAFVRWHVEYQQRISWFVIPLMFGQVGITAYEAWSAPGTGAWMACGLVGVAWVATFLLSVPCHQALQSRGKDARQIDRLIQTNWIRTLAWTGTFLLRLS